MAFTIKGYVLEKPRVGSANSPFTLTPDNLVTDQGAFDTAFPASEANPRAEYMVMVTSDGDLVDAEFGWTRNDLLQRFDWEGRDQRYKPLAGGLPTQVGALSLTANTTRLKAPAPKVSLVTSPVRLTVSGIELTVQAVSTDADFGSPISGVVQISRATGNLHWNTSDLSTYDGQSVEFQRQAFYTTKESSGAIGVIPPVGDPTAVLTPIPGTGQFPLLRFGFGLWLYAVEVVSFAGTPVSGSFQWKRGTGELLFNATDISNYRGTTIYYDGCLLGRNVQLPRGTSGTVVSPTTVGTVPLAGGDVIFRAVSTVVSGSGTLTSSSVLTTGASLAGVQVGDVLCLTSGALSGLRRKIVATGATLQVQPPFPMTGSYNFLVERVGNQFGQTLRYTSLAGQPAASSEQVAFDDTGAISTSSPDKALYSTQSLTYTIGDLPIENGISLRLFRSPVDVKATDTSLKDVSAYYTTTEATLADPLIGSPFVTLPIVPIEDASFPLVVRVAQGTGSYPEGPLPRLDGLNPAAASAGYTVDFEGRAISLAARKNNVISTLSGSGATNTPDPLVDPDNIVLELDEGSGYVTLVQGQDVLLDAASGVLQFVSTTGTTLVSGTASLTSTVLTDTSKNFSGLGVQAGDLLVLRTEGVFTVTVVGGSTLTFSPALGSVPSGFVPYEIRRGKEILADRSFQEVSLVDPFTKVERLRQQSSLVTSNSPRQKIPLDALSGYIRVQTLSGFETRTLTGVATSGSFSLPAFVPAGTIQVAQDTGELNFGTADLGLAWKSSVLLTLGVDYRLTPESGFVQTVERLLSNDELLLTYRTVLDDGTPGSVVTERATFLVRKELATYQAPSSSKFNKFNKTVASNPAPFVYRGGRPQDLSQVDVDITSATVTFLPDNQVTDALPHGSALGASERVLVDYFIYEAIGGENTTTALQAPMYVASIYSKMNGSITNGVLADTDTFYVPGDRRADFPAKSLLRVGAEEVYYLDTPTYSLSDDETTVKLLTPQVFRNSNATPKLFITSSPTPLTGTFLDPAYFLPETSFDRGLGAEGLPRGMNLVRLPGDKAAQYPTGTILYISSPLLSGATQDFYYVEGSAFKTETQLTEITIRGTTARQYNPLPDSDAATMRRSVRPILDGDATKASTKLNPVLTQGFVLYRQLSGQPGEILAYVAPGDPIPKSTLYSVDEAGTVTFTGALLPGEEISILYVGYTLRTGLLRVSYTSTIVPDSVNGLANQSLLADFTAFAPDTFYYRVETLTNYRGEIAKKYQDEAKASVPSGGPNTSNAAQSRLQDQGKASVFFEEGALYNEDIIARATLKYYHDVINPLEDILQELDGRVVGDVDGRFKFDGTLGALNGTTNQIDDIIQISPYPVKVTMPGFTFTFVGTYKKAYEPSPTSRFYPTSKTVYGTTTTGLDLGASSGTPLLDFGVKNLTGVSTIFRRPPRALLTVDATTSTVVVDSPVATDTSPDGVTKILRPAFTSGMKVFIPGYAAGPLTILSIAGNSVNLSGAVTAPKGSTLTLHPSDSKADGGYQQSYRPGTDVGVSLERGELSYIKPYPPFDGSVPLIPDDLCIQAPNSQEMLQATVNLNNTLTEPEKIPALFGQPLTDDGDQSIPYLDTNQTDSVSLLSQELNLLGVGGPIRSITTNEFSGVGSLSAGNTVITLTSGTFTGTAIQIWDLVFIVDGANGNANFRRVSAVTANSVTVDVAYPSPSTGFTFFVVRGTNVAAGTATSGTLSSLTQVGGSLSLIRPGHTLVITNGLSVGVRRQVTSVVGDTINFTPNANNVTVGTTYRVTNALASYSGTALPTLLSQESTQLGTLTTATNTFFNQVFTEVVPSSAGSVSGLVLTSAVNFTNAGVTSAHYVYIESGTSTGVFAVAQVTGTTLQVDASTPFLGSGVVTFRVVQAFEVAKQSLLDVSDTKNSNALFLSDTTSFSGKLTNSWLVATPSLPSGDGNYFVRRIQSSDYLAREIAVLARQTYLVDPSGFVATVERVLATADRLYDKRFTWIDARINLEKGILVQQSRAVANRLKAQADTTKQLLKLIAVEN